MKERPGILVASLALAMLVWLLDVASVCFFPSADIAYLSSATCKPMHLWLRLVLILAGFGGGGYFLAGLLKRCRQNIETAEHLIAVLDVARLYTRAVWEGESPDELLQRACQLLATVPHYRAVGIARLDADGGVIRQWSVGFDPRLTLLVQSVLEGGVGTAHKDCGSDGCNMLNVARTARLFDGRDMVDMLVTPLYAVDRPVLLGVLMVHTAVHYEDGSRELLVVQELSRELSGVLARLDDLTQRQGAEAALRESEFRYREIFEEAPVGIFQITVDGQILNVNQTLADVLGCDTVVEMGLFFPDFGRDLLSAMRRRGAFLARLQRDGDLRDFEYRVTRRDGTDVWLLINARLQRRSGNGAPVIDGFVRDNTERRYAEAALIESQRTLSTLMSNLPGMAYRCRNDERWTMLFVSEGCYPLTGYEASQVLENETVSYADLVLPQDRARVWTTVQMAVANRAPFEVEYRIRTADGTVKWVWEQGREVIVPGEPPVILEGLILDISSSKRAEAEREVLLLKVQKQADDLLAQAERLTEQATQLGQIMNTVPEGVLLLDADGRIVQANLAAERALAVLTDAPKHESSVGRVLTQLGDHRLVELLAVPPPVRLWHEVKTDTRVFEALAKPVAGRPGPEGWVLVIDDVTEERGVQLRAQQQQRLAAVGQLAAGIAHDFNNILAVIILYSQLALRQSDVSAKLREQLQIISREADHASDLIQQILDFGRRAELAPHTVDLAVFLHEQVQLLERTLPENITIKYSYGDENYSVSVDPSRLAQVIMNLAVNARDAMLHGGMLHIALSRLTVAQAGYGPVSELGSGDWVCVAVSDTGVGISSDILSRIFEPFFSTKGPLGSGLGLSQVHGIVAQHGGAIDVVTELGKGTTFTVYLPALADALVEQTPIPDVAIDVSSLEGEGEVLLIVEDDDSVRATLSYALTISGYRVIEARDGEEALDRLLRSHTAGTESIALVLADVVMPRMGGPALFRSMRARGYTEPVVMLTGHPMESELQALQREGVSGWMLKPPDLDALLAMLAGILRASS